MTRVYLYGIASAADNYAVVRYAYVDDCDRFVTAIKEEADVMRMNYPNIERIFMIDARGGLGDDYRRAIKQHSIESFAIFKDLLERAGQELK